MTIVSNTLCFAGYKYRALSPDLVDAITAAKPRWAGSPAALLLRLESFLQVTGRTLALSQLGSEEWKAALISFAAVLHAKSYRGEWASETGYTAFYLCRKITGELGDTTLQKMKLPMRKMTPQLTALLEEHEKSLIQERVNFWRGWSAKNRNGDDVAFRFYPLYERLGPEFTQRFFEVCSVETQGGRGHQMPRFANRLAAEIGHHPGVISAGHFQDAEWLYRFLKDFCIAGIRNAHARGDQLYSETRSWSRFAFFLEKAVLGKIWVDLGRPLPRPKAPVVVEGSRVVKTEDGRAVRRVLLTDVPVHMTDSEAKELLFRSVRSDLETIKHWAWREIADAWNRYNRRIELAPQGIVSTPGPTGKNSGLDWRLTRHCPDWLSHAAATFQHRGLSWGNERPVARAFYPAPLDETAWDLGIPTPNLLLAHATVLIAEHPQITPSFLEKFQIFDKEGLRAGFVETDGGHYLCGVKSRRGAGKAEQRIKLTDETAELVRQLVIITEPLRRELKAKGIPSWRRLFLATPSMGSAPKFWFGSGVSSRCALWLCGRLTACAGIEPAAAYELAKRFTLRSVRATAAVVIYLETGSLQKFSDALGHAECQPELLDSYLPRPIQEWFIERWIRIFQTGIVVEAMRDSHHLLRASRFNSMEELDAFLEHHALRKLPPHLDDPEHLSRGPVASNAEPRLVVGLDVAIFTVLLSLNKAVKQATRDVCGRARRWSMFCDRLCEHIESQHERPELQQILASAMPAVDVSLVEEYIYA